MRANKVLPRSESLVLPEVINPFVHDLQLTWWEKLQVAIMSVTIAPIRLVSLCVILLLAWPVAAFAVAFRSKEEKEQIVPVRGWRRRCSGRLLEFMGRACFFVMGFHYVNIKGIPASDIDAPLLVVAPHSSFFDVLVFFVLKNGLPSGVSRIESAGTMLIGTLATFTQPIWVSREDPNSRQNTIKEIKRRAQSKGEWPQIIVFPEGTCTNRSCLITFKPGGFYPGVPVQPVCLRFPNRLDTYTWTWEGPGAFTLFWLTLCQIHNRFEVEYLPVYKPNEEEIADPKLFAKNVREQMTKCLNVPATDHTFDDCRLMTYAAKLKLPMASGIVEFNKVNKKLGITFEAAKAMLEKFRQIHTGKEGKITVQELAEHLNLPVSEALEDVFTMYDRDNSGTIDFREYVIGLSLVSEPANTEDTIQLAFQLFDSEGKGYLSESDLAQMLHNAFGMNEEGVRKLFQQVDKDQDSKISFDEFKAYAKQKPEYAKLFMTYQKLTNSANSEQPFEEQIDNDAKQKQD
ncbi:lysophosphatidylcholine acyltransferase 2-like isoform X1 [Lingula anatina]|uniref:Lysophosphatidylcholine acyltransferase 2-like isoform X1 n=1 Tax=Lingula anatina TaxID=7574 RepID=A0A1S3H634_LINAN|nr:lysophosphatidylcholine acyltransferase 2-like isoform X1 [Lingula anatina]|eukprot:XP_013381447.1 lysophosphatidylcholine acyltransferase 2-like isoform X1 [Lingula anatina]